jgi:hypothetical protein
MQLVVPSSFTTAQVSPRGQLPLPVPVWSRVQLVTGWHTGTLSAPSAVCWTSQNVAPAVWLAASSHVAFPAQQ